MEKNKKAPKLESHILDLMKPEGFRARFYSLCTDYDTMKEAYEATERQFKSYFGERKYKNYESFRVTMNKKIKNKRN